MKKGDWVICLNSDFCVSTWGQIKDVFNPNGATVRYYGPIWESDLWDVKYLLLQSSKKGASNFYDKNYGQPYPKVDVWNSIQRRINANKGRAEKNLPLLG